MRIVRMASLFLATVFLAFGQLDSDTLTISASRSIIVPPDQALFNVSVLSDLNTSLDQVVAALQGTGMSASNLSTVHGYSPGPVNTSVTRGRASLRWYFTLLVPFTKMASVAATLTNLQKTIGQQNSGLTLIFSLSRLQVSPELQQSKGCLLSDVMADARVQAQTLADAAGLAVGPIVALSDRSGGQVLAGGFNTPSLGARLQAPTGISFVGLRTAPVSCFL